MKKLRGYIYSREFMGERVPQAVQNLVLRDYCYKNNVQYLLSSTEYAINNSSLILLKALDNLTNINGIVLYSLFQLPKDDFDRSYIFKKILKRRKELHFALENLIFKNSNDIETLENIWKIKITLPDCLKKENL
tara:strand:- start:20 stop:421 length:402 start_codon:yes stop_codon:yes gene_type:complete